MKTPTTYFGKVWVSTYRYSSWTSYQMNFSTRTVASTTEP